MDAGLSEVEVILEYQLPLTSKRADVVLAGRHPRTGEASYVVVELKQWTSAHLWEDDESLVTVDGMPGGPRLHPARQVRGYCEYVTDFVSSLSGHEDAVAGLAYLHNVTDRNYVSDLFFAPLDRQGQLFTGADRAKLHAYLRSRLDPTVAGAAAADELLNSAVRPSRQLLAVAADEVRDREQFVLQDDQQLAVDIVKHEVEQARQSNRKTVVVVYGGPGSGKSVIALSLLGDLAREGRTVLHATGSRSFTQTLRRVAGHRDLRVQKMFRYFNQFMDVERNGLDVLILDEAHRIRETSVNRYTRAEFRTDRSQLDELIAAARVPVFLLDNHQVVRPGEQGSVDSIADYARSLGLDLQEIELQEQYRCGGSLGDVRWVEQLLGLAGDGPAAWEGDERFVLDVADSPEELEQRVRDEAATGASARLAAGYCWSWSDPCKDGTLVPDVQIGPWARPWNLKGDRSIGGAPPAPLWSSDPRGIDQVGCVYTAQGFEYDWNGVIIGPDLVWRDGRFVSVRSANRDPDFRSQTAVSDADFDVLVRNVYKVLLTRGMVGTVLYATDAETRDALRVLVAGASNAGNWP
ncbi:DNA/RNA helicase domain-containing protein [uncultured Friedmanniella sp.]|uniref:DNA/RNA helicase domain-containing protein n=1 Tax=uncultured Friedmanniella sp. TaxID=335381 RepID=UPI0035CAC865